MNEAKTLERCDIAIIGGGPVGAALALALRDSGLSIRVLEARPAGGVSRDARALALSCGTKLLLDRLGVWDRLAPISAIRTIHISQRGSFGRAVIRATELDVPELGYVLPYPMLHDALDDAMRKTSATVAYGAAVNGLDSTTEETTIRYRVDATDYLLPTRLAVVADGGRLLAERFPPEKHDYGQSAVIAHVTCADARPDTAYERFTPQGPMALLPYQGGYELVWTAPHERAQEMINWSNERFLAELHQHFGDRVGVFTGVDHRACFALGLKRALDQAPLPRTVLIGNAAQTLHPVAGQGFNLGVRDAWELAQVALDTRPEALGSAAMLAAYRASRHTDREAGIRFTDGLVRLFSNDLPLLTPARAAALTALDLLPLAKRFVAKRMMFGANG